MSFRLTSMGCERGNEEKTFTLCLATAHLVEDFSPVLAHYPDAADSK